jgi:hypothetical protein
MGVVSQSTLSTGSTWSARNDEPRWALTAKRKSSGVAASQPSTAAALGWR